MAAHHRASSDVSEPLEATSGRRRNAPRGLPHRCNHCEASSRSDYSVPVTTSDPNPRGGPRPPRPAAAPDEPAETKAPQRPARRAVVAEDEALIRMDVVETLREAGFEVVGEAGDGETAVQLATELRPDVVVMDVKMPVLDGISAAERIGKAHLAPVVLLTAFSQTELVERARDAGAMAYVVKPFSPADLLPGARDRDLALLADQRAGVRGRRPHRAVRDAQARGPRQGPAHDEDGPDRAGVVPLDPEDVDGPPPHHA